MITEVLLVLPLYLILFFIWWRFQPLTKAMTDVGDIFYRKQECLKSLIDRGKLGHKWTYKRVDKSSDETISKKYVEYKQHELNEKGEKTGKALGKHAINLLSTGISRILKIRDVKKLQLDIENDPIIKDHMASLGCLLVCTLGNLLVPVLVTVYTLNNLDLGNENEGYKRD